MICKKCNKTFPVRQKINGFVKNLCKRKYCLTCSPFGFHNTRPIYDENSLLDKATITCKYCNKIYIYKRSNRKGHTRTICNSCAANRRRYALKFKALEYKGNSCEGCGYNKCPGALHFHHKNPELKEFGIGGSHTRSWLAIKDELDKCIILCANCHAERHYNNSKLLLIDYIYTPSITKIRQKAIHGTYSKYCSGCRCLECKNGASIYSKNKRKLAKENQLLL